MAIWKNTTQPFHTIGTPPRIGSTMRAIIGSTRKTRKPLRNIAVPNSGTAIAVESDACLACVEAAGRPVTAISIGGPTASEIPAARHRVGRGSPPLGYKAGILLTDSALGLLRGNDDRWLAGSLTRRVERREIDGRDLRPPRHDRRRLTPRLRARR